MKRLFIIGASVLQLPAIKRAKDLGYTVAVADYDPQAVGIPYADTYYNVSTIDEQGICAAARDFGADGVMTLATDMPMRSVAYTCQQLGLTGITYDTAVKATDKGEMIRAFAAAGVAHPWYFILTDPAQWDTIRNAVRYPCITKPMDNSGSRGIMLVHNETELKSAIAYSADNGRGGGVIIEEYMQGPEVSVEIVVCRGTPHILQITDKLTTGAPHFVEMGHSQPSRLDDSTQTAIRDLASQAVRAVGLTDGPAHVEIIVTPDGPKMVEMGARMGGGCITTHLVPLSTGVDMIKATIDICLGNTPDIEQKHACGAAIRFLNPNNGHIDAVTGMDKATAIPGIQEITLTKQVGDTVVPLESGADRVGYVIAQADTPAKAVTLCEQAMDTIHFTIS